MYDQAYKYYPEKWQGRLNAYVIALSVGEDASNPKSVRAKNLWKAACIMRYEGMELFGSEVAPDWYYYEGNFDLQPLHYIRGSDEHAKSLGWGIGHIDRNRIKEAKLVGSSIDEQKKIEMHPVTPERRFHYRYNAIDMAWKAAQMMEDNSDLTARVLCIAGKWQEKLDNGKADVFYKMMVKRCGSTELGKQADELRWFPNVEIDKAKLLQ